MITVRGIGLNERKLEACAQALFRKRKEWVDGIVRELGEEPTVVLWANLGEAEQEEYLDEAYLVLRTWGVEEEA